MSADQSVIPAEAGIHAAYPETARELEVWNGAIEEVRAALARAAVGVGALPLGEGVTIYRRKLTIELIEALAGEAARLIMTVADLQAFAAERAAANV